MNPSTVQARKMVLVSAMILLALGLYRGKQGSTDTGVAKRLWGVGMLTLMLSILADFAPSVAGPFAVLAVLGSLSNGGDKAIQNLLGNLSGGAATVHTTTRAGTTTGTTQGRVGGTQ